MSTVPVPSRCAKGSFGALQAKRRLLRSPRGTCAACGIVVYALLRDVTAAGVFLINGRGNNVASWLLPALSMADQHRRDVKRQKYN